MNALPLYGACIWFRMETFELKDRLMFIVCVRGFHSLKASQDVVDSIIMVLR